MPYAKKDYKLGTKKSGLKDTIQELQESGMPLRQTLASGKAPAIGISYKKIIKVKKSK